MTLTPLEHCAGTLHWNTHRMRTAFQTTYPLTESLTSACEHRGAEIIFPPGHAVGLLNIGRLEAVKYDNIGGSSVNQFKTRLVDIISYTNNGN